MKRKQIWTVLLAVLLLAVVAGCSNNTSKPVEGTKAGSEEKKGKEGKSEEGTYKFTDSVGREVELPKNIERIAPSGPAAQIVLYTLSPDKLVGLADKFGESKYIDKKYSELPVFGNLYGDTLNMESLVLGAPQVIIDIGEPKKGIKEDMDGVQEKTGIPTIFIQMEIDSIVSAYKTLGEVLGMEKEAGKLIDYVEKTLSETAKKVVTIPEDKRVKVYYGQEEALTAVVKGTVHSDVIDKVGGNNVADVEQSLRGGASEVSMEQILLWNPDVVLFGAESTYDSVANLPEWQGLDAIKNKKYYAVPTEPYNWLGRPPSVNRILGVRWLSNLLYPDVFPYDMLKETKEFYNLFYHSDITDEQARELLSKSSAK